VICNLALFTAFSELDLFFSLRVKVGLIDATGNKDGKATV
jgi:hypothetical protein